MIPPTAFPRGGRQRRTRIFLDQKISFASAVGANGSCTIMFYVIGVTYWCTFSTNGQQMVPTYEPLCNGNQILIQKVFVFHARNCKMYILRCAYLSMKLPVCRAFEGINAGLFLEVAINYRNFISPWMGRYNVTYPKGSRKYGREFQLYRHYRHTIVTHFSHCSHH